MATEEISINNVLKLEKCPVKDVTAYMNDFRNQSTMKITPRITKTHVDPSALQKYLGWMERNKKE